MNGHTNGSVSGTGFLSFNSHPPHIFVTSEDDEFDEKTLQLWRDEGFLVSYHPMRGGGKEYRELVKSWSATMRLGESYAIIAYGETATICLDIATKPMPHCCTLVCYYPTKIPHPNQKYPTQLQLTIHLTESQGLTASFPTFVYSGVEDGFAEHDLDVFDKTAADLAWTRSLTALRRGFKQETDLDSVRDLFSSLTLEKKNPSAAIATMIQDPYVNYAPTGTGGIGRRALLHFYTDFFDAAKIPSFKVKLISRTSGVDRVVDEMVVSFKHTQEIPWILPGVPPTEKFVQIPIISIVAVRGGKLASEHVYWDQASVLAQIGALDPDAVPKHLASKGCKKLPVLGADEARKILDVNSVASNDLIPNW